MRDPLKEDTPDSRRVVGCRPSRKSVPVEMNPPTAQPSPAVGLEMEIARRNTSPRKGLLTKTVCQIFLWYSQ